MLYREIMAVCSEIHTKHINTLCGQNVELLNVKLVVHIVTTGLQKVKLLSLHTQAAGSMSAVSLPTSAMSHLVSQPAPAAPTPTPHYMSAIHMPPVSLLLSFSYLISYQLLCSRIYDKQK